MKPIAAVLSQYAECKIRGTAIVVEQIFLNVSCHFFHTVDCIYVCIYELFARKRYLLERLFFILMFRKNCIWMYIALQASLQQAAAQSQAEQFAQDIARLKFKQQLELKVQYRLFWLVAFMYAMHKLYICYSIFNCSRVLCGIDAITYVAASVRIELAASYETALWRTVASAAEYF